LKILFSKGEQQGKKVNDNQDGRMAEKLEALSLIVAMLDVFTPSQ
jgi:hypothetical protein